ncbi:MAG: hypothetical protein IMZ43_11020 [Thermoplasmata archaeon]|nr:hypothetical protein [Thermoplasmata archaeon]
MTEQSGFVLISNWGKPQANNKFMNNIISDAGGGYEIDAKNFISTMAFDYNLYYNSVRTNKWRWNNVDYTTFSGWKTASGQDAHGVNGNPLFMNAGAWDFHLKSASPAINAGGFLTSTVGSGTNSKTMVVSDPYWFTDGYGLDTGDVIQLTGQTASAVITAINYNNGP